MDSLDGITRLKSHGTHHRFNRRRSSSFICAISEPSSEFSGKVPDDAQPGSIWVCSMLPEACAEVARPSGVAFLAVERRPHQLLEVGWLSVQEEFVHGCDR